MALGVIAIPPALPDSTIKTRRPKRIPRAAWIERTIVFVFSGVADLDPALPSLLTKWKLKDAGVYTDGVAVVDGSTVLP